MSALRELFYAINKGHKVIIQHALFLSNFSKLSLIQKGHAFYQSRWTIGHEMRRVSLANKTGLYYYNIVGHGTCLQLKKLEAIGRFPEDVPIEDSAIGYILSVQGERAHSLHSLEMSDNPVRAIDGYRQQRTWAMGPMYILSYYRSYLSNPRFKQKKVKAKWIAFTGMFGFIAWASSSFFIIYALSCLFFWKIWPLLFLASYSVEFFQAGRFFCRRGYISKQDFYMFPVYILPELFRRSIPALHALYNVIVLKRVEKAKTEHD